MTEAVRTSETLINIYQITRRDNAEDSHLRIKEFIANQMHQVSSGPELTSRRAERLENYYGAVLSVVPEV